MLAFVRASRVDAVVEMLDQRKAAFDDRHASAFVIVVGEDPERAIRKDALPGRRFLFDVEADAADRYGARETERWFLIDPALHILAATGPDQADALVNRVSTLPPPARHGGCEAMAPVLITPASSSRRSVSG